MQYRPEVDGLRAFAVLPVILFHAGWPLFQGGYVGVDIFFVISGYLITSIILGEQAQGQFSLLRFYERRARRILPALYVVLLSCLPVAWAFMDPFELKEFGQSLVATVTFSSNIFFGLKSGYFDAASELKPLLHTWSLSLEEQYYLFFPFLLMWLSRHWPQRKMLILIGLALCSLTYAQWQSSAGPGSVFYATSARIWELLVGSLLACHLQRAVAPSGGQWFAAAGLGMVLGSIFGLNANLPFPGLWGLLPTLGAALIIWGTTTSGWVTRFMSWRGFVQLGLISYSAYLWHQPLLALGRVYYLDELPVGWVVTMVVATLALAYLTKRFVEDYFRYRFARGKRHIVFLFSGAFAVVLALIGLSAHVTNGFPLRSELNLQLAQNFGLSEACNGADMMDRRCRTADDPRVMLWGDSYAMHLAKALAMASNQSLIQATLSACPPLPGFAQAGRRAQVSCEEFNAKVADVLLTRKMPSVKTVVISSTFHPLSQPQWRDKQEQLLQQLTRAGYHVVLVGPTPTHEGLLKCIKQADRRRESPQACRFPLKEMPGDRQMISDTLQTMADRSGAEYADLRKFMCPDGVCQVMRNGVLLYRDDGHLSNASAPIFSEMFLPLIGAQGVTP